MKVININTNETGELNNEGKIILDAGGVLDIGFRPMNEQEIIGRFIEIYPKLEGKPWLIWGNE